jgi:hypothetical protein
VHGDDAEDFVDRTQELPLFAMGSQITFSPPEIETYYSVRMPELKLRRSGESRAPCPIHKGKGDNFAVKMETGEWFCQSQCQRGGDIIALEMALTGRGFATCKAEVFRIVGRTPEAHRNGTSPQGDPSEKSQRPTTNSGDPNPGSKLPATAHVVRQRLAKRGFQAVVEHQYGQNLRKVRFEHQSNQQEGKNRPEKTFRWEHKANGVWYSGDGDLPKPLYVNDVFRERDQVEFAMGFEGEAKADVAGELGFPAFSFKNITPEQVATLVGCEVVLWPDNDGSGIQQATDAAHTIHQAGQIPSIKFVTPPPELPPAGDIVDAVRTLSWDNARVTQFLQTATDYQPAEPEGLPKPDLSEEADSGDRSTQSQLLLQFAKKAGFFHTPDGDAYACLPVGGHREVWPVRSKSCKRWLTQIFYEAFEKPPSAQALQDALGALEAKAQFASPESLVHTRVAAYGDAVYIDLCNDKWQAVEITSKGWKVVSKPPVHFRRSSGMHPLPTPLDGGSLSNLRKLINIGDDKNWVLLVSWLIATCRPQGPYPVLILQGEQGSAKSTTAKLLRKLIDPAKAPLRTPPREERDLLIAANNSWVVAYDNLSGIPQWLSDALCRLATSGGFATRELYTDSDEIIFDLARPVILNGIDQLAERPDLADRAIILNLPPIEETARRDEAELHAVYDRERPYLLGALFNAVSVALTRFPNIALPRKPRMADFAMWATAAEPALGFQEGTFMNAYSGNRAEAVQETLESDPVGAAIVQLINDKLPEGEWTGTATELLARLESIVEDRVKKSSTWPKSARKLSGSVRRLITFLREAGIKVTFERKGTGGRRPLTITRIGTHFTAVTATTADGTDNFS